MNAMKILAFTLIVVGFAIPYVANFVQLSDSPAEGHLRAALLSLASVIVFVAAFLANRLAKRGPKG